MTHTCALQLACPLVAFVFILKATTGIMGIVLGLTGLYSLYPFGQSLKQPSITILKVYTAVFGISILLLEGKNFLPDHSGLRRWFYREFHFLSSPRGKGFYLLHVATISFTLWRENILFSIAGSIVCLLAIVYHIGYYVEAASVSKGKISPLRTQLGPEAPPKVKYASLYDESPAGGYDGGHYNRSPQQYKPLPHFPEPATAYIQRHYNKTHSPELDPVEQQGHARVPSGPPRPPTPPARVLTPPPQPARVPTPPMLAEAYPVQNQPLMDLGCPPIRSERPSESDVSGPSVGPPLATPFPNDYFPTMQTFSDPLKAYPTVPYQ